MSDLYLVSLSIGPVQDFIAAARRTSDLFAGSAFLSDITAAAARAFPDPPPDGEFGIGRVFPCDTGKGGANKILAIVLNPEECVARAESQAKQVLLQAWMKALDDRENLTQAQFDALGAHGERAGAQLRDFLEFYAVWLPVDEPSYARRRGEVERLLAGRKALRNFSQTTGDDEGIFNSPLDPSRASVVTGPNQYSVPTVLQEGPLFLKPSETLDAISLLKRLNRRAYLDRLREADGPAPHHVPSTRELAQRAIEPSFPSAPSPYVNQDMDDHDDPEFVPGFAYFCVLVADGDHMGELLGKSRTAGQQRAMSRSLDAFAEDACRIINEHRGVPVYTGGDDVLALLPVTTALACAIELNDAFGRHLEPHAFTVGLKTPTLSAGLAVCHDKEPLSRAIQRAHDCEAHAKDERHSVAFGVYHRSGEPLRVRQTWEDVAKPTGLAAWVERAQAGRISRGLPHALRDLVRTWPSDGQRPDVLDAEIRRVYDHSEPGIPKDEMSTIKDEGIPRFADVGRRGLAAAGHFADSLIIARFLAGISPDAEAPDRVATGGAS
ncbi:MAG: type III-B CRISPR-associated protein Cas10/Cmr2 [Actinomycetia bacterium]|nr:type III-B CRISPR-associated protein Cas10/Cmr2 [Actinomycetes bacterium]